MDAKEAKMILTAFDNSGRLAGTGHDIGKAMGYLEALNGPEVAAKDAAYAALYNASKALVEAVKEIQTWGEFLPSTQARIYKATAVIAQFEEARK